MSWARLLKRVLDIDIEHCPNCGGDLKIIAAIEDPLVIVRILSHLGLPARAPPRASVRLPQLIQAALIETRHNGSATQAGDPARPAAARTVHMRRSDATLGPR